MQEPGSNLSDVSLTSHLQDMDSPVRRFMLAHFPDAPLARKALAVLPTSSVLLVESARLPAPPLPRTWYAPDAVELPSAAGYPWPTVGTAFDFRLRFCLGASPVTARVAESGARQLVEHWRFDGTLPAAFDELRDRFDGLVRRDASWARAPSSETRRDLAKLSYVLALYEQCYRAPFLDSWPVVSAGPTATFDELAAFGSDAALDDIDAMAQLFIATQPELLAATSIVLNPFFGEASSQLGGADADLILDGRLIDIKTKKKAEIARVDLWQLLGYALADVDDVYGIEEVGLYFSRHGVQVAWSLDALMEFMAGVPHDRIEVRHQFRAMLDALRPPRHTAVEWFVADDGEVRDAAGRPTRGTALLSPERAAARRDLQERRSKVAHALVFRPPVSGRGKWHVAFSDNQYVRPPDDGRELSVRPSCGSNKVALDRTAKPLRLVVGAHRSEYAAQCCGRCLVYSAFWFTSLRNRRVPIVAPRERWCFSEPQNPRQKWHVKRSDFYVRERSSSSVCGSYGEFMRGGATIPAAQARPDDPRFCAYCLRIVSEGAPRWMLDAAAGRSVANTS